MNAVEKKKNFKRDPNLVFRHMISEMGELDAKMYELEKMRQKIKQLGFMHADDFHQNRILRDIGYELIDIIFLACFMAELFGVKIEPLISARMNAIARQYEVPWPV